MFGGWVFGYNNDWKKPNSKYYKAKARLNDILKYKFRLMCLSLNRYKSDNTLLINGWKMFRMWSQYGENHFGVCLVFSKKKLLEFIEKASIEYYVADKVIYSKEETYLDNALSLSISQINNSDLDTFCLRHIKSHIDKFFFTKHLDYRDEAEYRVVIYDNNNDYKYFDLSTFIKCVIIGERMPKVYYPLIKNLCDKTNTECRRVEYSNGKLSLLNL
ncbi:DUF2971 domain-containing protein [Candidatus Neomarinimicrobiota bacterium]